MNLVKKIEQYDNKNLFLCEPTKNNVMTDGNFIRILYSTNNVTLNGIYLLISLTDISTEKYFTKYKCYFNVQTHKDMIENLKYIEEGILSKYKTNKMPAYKIYEQITLGFIKLFADIGNKPNCSLILKISGIWETSHNYGLTYKFMVINN